MESMPYSDWFGDGDTREDVKDAIKKHGIPLQVFVTKDSYASMAAIVYSDKVVCVGYDGGEYKHFFEMQEQVEPPTLG